MYYGLVYYPKTEIFSINKIRKKYDPTYKLISPHLTMMFPVPASIGKSNIIRHVGSILANRTPIKIYFSGFMKSWNHWLLLAVGKGKEDIKNYS